MSFAFYIDPAIAVVNGDARMESLARKKKPFLIYHTFNVTNAYATINIQFRHNYTNSEGRDRWVPTTNSRVILLVRHGKMPILTECDVVKAVANISGVDGT